MIVLFSHHSEKGLQIVEYKLSIRDIPKREMVYSKRFPRVKTEYKSMLGSGTPEERAAAMARIMAGLIEDGRKPASPALLERGERFIELAKSIAETYRVDTDIFRDNEVIDVIFFFSSHKIYMEMGSMLAQIIRMSDDIAFLPFGSGVQLILGFCLRS